MKSVLCQISYIFTVISWKYTARVSVACLSTLFGSYISRPSVRQIKRVYIDVAFHGKCSTLRLYEKDRGASPNTNYFKLTLHPSIRGQLGTIYMYARNIGILVRIFVKSTLLSVCVQYAFNSSSTI